MEKQRNRHIWIGVLVLFLSYMFIRLSQDTSFLTRQYKSVSARLSKETVTASMLDHVVSNLREEERNEFTDITLWKHGEKEIIENPVLERSVRISVTLVYGVMECVAPMELVQGNYVFREDSKGCVLDEKTAFILFGSKDVIGNEIRVSKQSFYVRGVIRSEEPLFLYQSKMVDTMYDNIEFLLQDNQLEQGRQLVEALLYQNEWNEDAVIINGMLYAYVIKRLASLPFWVLFVITTVGVLRYLKEKQQKNFYVQTIATFFCFLFCFLLSALFLNQVVGNPFYLPKQFVPTKWSDFDFWVQKFQWIQENRKVIRYLLPNIKDVILIQLVDRCVVEIAAGSLLAGAFYRKLVNYPAASNGTFHLSDSKTDALPL